MLVERSGNLLGAEVDALVNTVNTVGVMGKGIALQFKRAYPDNYKHYERACKAGQVQIGKMFVVPTNSMSKPFYIINFPTKEHWRSPSNLADIESGLDDLVTVLRKFDIQSVAVPPLGCGNGGLEWRDVYPLIIATAERVPDVDFLVYPPTGSPSAAAMSVRSKRPTMTKRRAAILLGFDRYVTLSMSAGHAIGGEFSIMEAQKVVYFLQLAGWASAFDFAPSHYGPYAHTVDQWLSSVEGHFISGYGDGTSGSRAVLRIKEDVLDEAGRIMADDSEFSQILDRLEQLVRGFEFPYGVELLSTVHYIVTHDPQKSSSVEKVVDGLGAWSQRKARLFRPYQAKVAVDHLVNVGAVDRN